MLDKGINKISVSWMMWLTVKTVGPPSQQAFHMLSASQSIPSWTNAELINAHIPSHSIQNQSGHSCVYLGLTHFGTTTSKVMRYSESSTKSSFLTMSARLLVNRLPLLAHDSITTTQTHMRVLLLIKAFRSQSIQTRSR